MWFFFLQVLEEADVDNDDALNFLEFERIMTLNVEPEFMRQVYTLPRGLIYYFIAYYFIEVSDLFSEARRGEARLV